MRLRWSVILVLFCAVLVSSGVKAAPGRSEIGGSSPVWLPDSSSLLFMRQITLVDPLRRQAVPGSAQLFWVGGDGRGLRPVNTSLSAISDSRDELLLLPAPSEVWITQAGRPETARVLWYAPEGHLICDARFGDPSGFLILTHSQGSFTLWSANTRGETVSSQRLLPGGRFAWSHNARYLLIGGSDGLWGFAADQPSRPRHLAAKEVESFAFLDSEPGLACFRADGRVFTVSMSELEKGAVPAAAGFDPAALGPRASIAPGVYGGSLTYATPGPSGELLISDGRVLQSLSLATGRAAALAEAAPEGRCSWNPEGDTVAFSSRGNLLFYHSRTGKAEPAGSGRDPVFSPRGDQVAFWREQAGGARVIVRGYPNGREWLSVAGKQPVWLTYRELACITRQRDNWQVALVNLKDGTARPITKLTFYSIQLAAFPTLAEARSFADRLPGCFSAVGVQETSARGARWYRVRAGAFSSTEQAESAFAEALPQLKTIPGWDGSHIIAPAVNDFGWLWPAPDGSALVFEAMGAIYHYDCRKGTLKTLWRPAAYSLQATRQIALSPNGRRIAFIDEAGRLNVMPVSGGKATVVCGASQF